MGMQDVHRNIPHIGFGLQCKLELQDIGGPVDHGTAFGRIAFACPKDEVCSKNP